MLDENYVNVEVYLDPINKVKTDLRIPTKISVRNLIKQLVEDTGIDYDSINHSMLRIRYKDLVLIDSMIINKYVTNGDVIELLKV